MASVSVRETFDTAIGGAYDVIVAGGGASGLIAAVAASRLGARTLLLERQGCLGGTATTAYVAQYLPLCAAPHNCSNREVSVMRRSATWARSGRGVSGRVLHIISVHSVSSQASTLASRFHDGSLPLRAGAPTRSSAFRFVSRLAWA